MYIYPEHGNTDFNKNMNESGKVIYGSQKNGLSLALFVPVYDYEQIYDFEQIFYAARIAYKLQSYIHIFFRVFSF
jgi:hypothetical protein